MSWIVIELASDPTGIVEVPDDGGRKRPPEVDRAQPLTVYCPGYSWRKRLEALPVAEVVWAGAPFDVKLRVTDVPAGSPRMLTVTGTLLSCIGRVVVVARADGVRPHDV